VCCQFGHLGIIGVDFIWCEGISLVFLSYDCIDRSGLPHSWFFLRVMVGLSTFVFLFFI